MNSISLFAQERYARTEDGEQLIILGVVMVEHNLRFLVVFNDPQHPSHGKAVLCPRDQVTFEHYYWPVFERPPQPETEHPQDPAGLEW